MGQGKAHHGAAHDDPLPGLRSELVLTQQPAHRGADTHPYVAGTAKAFTRQGDHAPDQRFILQDGLPYGKGSADVKHHHAQRKGALAGGNLLAGEDLDKLTGGPGGVFGGDHPHLNGLAIYHSLHGGNGFRLVIFNGDQGQLGFENMPQYLDTLGYAGRLVPHQSVITADIGFALGTIDDQQLYLLATGGQFHIGRKAGATQTHYAGIVNAADQIHGRMLCEIGQRESLAPSIFTIRADMDADLAKAGGVGHGMRFNRHYFARGRSMNGGLHARSRTGKRLTGQHLVTDTYRDLGTGAYMLLKRQDQDRRQRRFAKGRLRGFMLVLIRMDPAVKVPQFAL